MAQFLACHVPVPVHISGVGDPCSRTWISKDKPPFAGEKTETDVFPMCLRLKKVHKASDWLSKKNCFQNLGQLEGPPSAIVPCGPLVVKKTALPLFMLGNDAAESKMGL